MSREKASLGSSVPKERPRKSVTLGGFVGIDRRRRLDSAAVIGGYGIGHAVPGALCSAEVPIDTGERYENPVSMCSVGDSLAIVYQTDDGLRLAIRGGEHPFDVSLAEHSSVSDPLPRSICAFNYYTDPLDPIGGSFERQILVFPDKIRLRLVDGDWTVEHMESEGRVLPNIDRACVHLSRLYGAGDDRVWVSAYNSPDDFELDTASEYGSSSAWASTVQSNTRADGEICAMTLYDGHVLCFKRNFCHSINNNKNPFRIVDLFCRGARSAEAITELDGRLIFISEDGIYSYGGASPERVSDALCVRDFGGSMLCSHAGLCYIYVASLRALYTFDPEHGEFGRVAIADGLRITALAASDSGAYFLSSDGALWRIDSGEFGDFRVESAALTLGFDRPFRLDDVSVMAELGKGARLRIGAVDADGKERLLGEFVGDGLHPRRFIADACGIDAPIGDSASIVLSGKGEIVISSVRLRGVGVRSD